MPFSLADAASGPSPALAADARASALVGAARELTAESASSAFTVQQVVERAGLSLKSFYRCFEGKDDLLLALLAQDCALGASVLAEMVGAHRRPDARLRAWVRGLFELMAAGEQGYVRVLVREHRRLSERRPGPMARATAPFIDLLCAELEAAQRVGLARAGDARRHALRVFDLVLADIHELAQGREPRAPAEVADDLWSFCWLGLSVVERSRPPRTERQC